MAAVLKIFDQVAGRGRQFRRDLVLVSQRVTASDVIRRRIEAEAADRVAAEQNALAASREAFKTWLVVPSLKERALNGDRGAYGPASQQISRDTATETEMLVETALKAFTRNGYIMFFDGRQLTRLDEEVALTGASEATFIRLIPLVGG